MEWTLTPDNTFGVYVLTYKPKDSGHTVLTLKIVIFLGFMPNSIIFQKTNDLDMKFAQNKLRFSWPKAVKTIFLIVKKNM